MKFRSLLPFTALALGCFGSGKAPPAPAPQAVTVISPVLFPVQKSFEYNGTLEAVETVQIQARVEGFLNEITFKEGDEVAAGKLLYIIDPREYVSAVAKARADIARAVADMKNAAAQIKLAEDELARLTKSGSASQSELEQSKAKLAAMTAQQDVAVANKSSAEAAERTAELKRSYTEIKSPIDGRIGRTLVTKGNLVGQKDATLLTTIVSTHPIFVYFDVPEKDVATYRGLLKPASGQSMPVFVGLGTEDGFPHKGTLDFQDNRVTTSTGTIRIRGRIDNLPDPTTKIRPLQPGNYCRIRVPVGEPQPQLAIPEESLMTGQEGRFVFTLGKDNIVQKRTVKVGPQVWRMGNPGPAWTLTNPRAEPGQPPSTPVRTVVSILSGLEPGDKIVAVGLLKARPGQPVAPDEWNFRAPAVEPK